MASFYYICIKCFAMRRFLLTICLSLLALVTRAQETEEDYYRYKIDRSMEPVALVESDTLLFYRLALSQQDLYEEVTAYRFAFAENARRGFYFAERGATLDGIGLRRANISLLRRLGLSERGYAGLDGGRDHIGAEAGVDEFSSRDGVPVGATNVGLFFSGRGYMGGVRATVSTLMRRGWSLTLHAAARGGNDLYVKGVYNNSVDAGLRLGKSFSSGASLSIVALATVGERGLRSGSTDEAFTLTGDRLYNPSWGYQAGRVRNSRYRRDAVPFGVVSLSVPLGAETTMNVAVGGDYGERAYSSLGWYDAMTPRPDNYRYLPSYQSEPTAKELVAEEWRASNPKYTQIDWDELYTRNRISADGAVYAMDERVERMARAEAVVGFRTEVGGHTTLSYGLRGTYNSSRNFKRLEDLMGASHLMDIDYYLLDDDSFSHQKRNNLRDSDVVVSEGDRFSYDYALVERSLMADFGVEYAADRLLLRVQASVGNHSIHRRGYFEKELFAGEGSFGRSAQQLFMPYTLKAAISYSFTPRHNLNLRLMQAEAVPEARNLFLNPLYNNRVVDNPTTERHTAAELSYKYSSSVANISLTAYYAATADESQTYRAYDDLSATYCDVVISDLGILRYGVEAAAVVELSDNWRASMSAAAGRFLYSNNPLVALYDDANNHEVVSAAESYVGDCRVGGAPQLSGSMELTYHTYRGWIVSCGVQGVAERYVDPSLVRRQERVAVQGAASQEIFEQFMSQRRLDDALTVDASLSRWFNVGRSRLSLTLSVRNLLGHNDIVYSGYESSRIRNYRSGAQRIYAPHDDVLTYAYGRTYYAVVSWKF